MRLVERDEILRECRMGFGSRILYFIFSLPDTGSFKNECEILKAFPIDFHTILGG